MYYVVPGYFYRGQRVYLFVYRVALPRGGIRKKNTGRGPRERCRSAPQGGVKKKKIARGPRERCRSVPALLLASFLRGSLTFIPRSWPLNRTETLHTGYRGL